MIIVLVKNTLVRALRPVAGVLLLIYCAWTSSQAHANCTVDADLPNVIKNDAVQLGWQTTPVGIKAGEPFELQVAICPHDATLQAIDATMPMHRHGMNYRPSIHPLGNGRWRVEGMIWHMSGKWQLAISVRLPGNKQATPFVMTQDVTLQ